MGKRTATKDINASAMGVGRVVRWVMVSRDSEGLARAEATVAGRADRAAIGAASLVAHAAIGTAAVASAVDRRLPATHDSQRTNNRQHSRFR